MSWYHSLNVNFHLQGKFLVNAGNMLYLKLLILLKYSFYQLKQLLCYFQINTLLNSRNESFSSAIIYTLSFKPFNFGFDSVVNKHMSLVNYLSVLIINSLLLLEMSLVVILQFSLHGLCFMALGHQFPMGKNVSSTYKFQSLKVNTELYFLQLMIKFFQEVILPIYLIS